MSLPVVPPRLDELRLPKRWFIGLVVAAMFGASATVASIVAARTAMESGVAQKDDVLHNREILNSVCENARVLTEQFATATPAPCPTEDK